MAPGHCSRPWVPTAWCVRTILMSTSKTSLTTSESCSVYPALVLGLLSITFALRGPVTWLRVVHHAGLQPILLDQASCPAPKYTPQSTDTPCFPNTTGTDRIL